MIHGLYIQVTDERNTEPARPDWRVFGVLSGCSELQKHDITYIFLFILVCPHFSHVKFKIVGLSFVMACFSRNRQMNPSKNGSNKNKYRLKQAGISFSL